jgi:hypothetical protein
MGAYGLVAQDRRERVHEAVARSEQRIARSLAAVERSQAAMLRGQAGAQRVSTRAVHEHDDRRYQITRGLRDTRQQRREVVAQAQAVRRRAAALRSSARDTAARIASTLEGARIRHEGRSVAARG